MRVQDAAKHQHPPTMNYRQLIQRFKLCVTLTEKQRVVPELAATLVTKTRHENFMELVFETLERYDRGQAGFVTTLLANGLCADYGSNLYYVSFKPVLENIYENKHGLSSYCVWLAPRSKFGPGPCVQHWLPFERSFYDHATLLTNPIYAQITASERPKNLTPLLRIAFHDTGALLKILQGLNRITQTTNLSFDLAMTVATFVSRIDNNKAVAQLACSGVQHKTMAHQLDVTLDLAHWKRITQVWHGVPVSVCFLELFLVEDQWQVWFFMESVSTLVSIRLQHSAVGFDRNMALLEGTLESDYSHMGLFPVQTLKREMKKVANYTDRNTSSESAIEIRCLGMMNQIVLTTYATSVYKERTVMEYPAPFGALPNRSPKIYKRDFYKLLLGTRGKYVKLAWGLEDTVGAVLDVRSKYVWLKDQNAWLIYIINPTEKARRLDELQKVEAMGRVLEDYMRIQRRLYQAGLRETYVAGSRDKFNKWEKWRTGTFRGRLEVDSREQYPHYVKLWEWIYMKPLPPGRHAGYLLTLQGGDEYRKMVATFPQIRACSQLYEWKLWARELLYALHIYIRERHSLSFDFAKPPAGKFKLPLLSPFWPTDEQRGTVTQYLARLATLAR